MLRGNHFKNIQSLKFEKTSSNNANFDDQGVSAWRSKFFNAQVFTVPVRFCIMAFLKNSPNHQKPV